MADTITVSVIAGSQREKVLRVLARNISLVQRIVDETELTGVQVQQCLQRMKKLGWVRHDGSEHWSLNRDFTIEVRMRPYSISSNR